MKIAIGCDHAGFELKEKLKSYIQAKGWEVKDMGTHSEERADYPDFAHLVAIAVENKDVDYGLLMCGSGNGINMAANKHKGIRSALCWTAEIAELARLHNDANIMTLPARFIAEAEAKKCIDLFYTTAFEGGRHAGRVDKISKGC
ncbi:MAG TPA: ribose 5-phosphate isomerase B [Bacteroidia bacterium]|jgi:ribose 5-phosphate isomerase B|nr:ribose 5-phosphate isomerase B [Bacteroidia bacterium]